MRWPALVVLIFAGLFTVLVWWGIASRTALEAEEAATVVAPSLQSEAEPEPEPRAEPIAPQPIPDAEATAFAQRLCAALRDLDDRTFMRTVDMKALAIRAGIERDDWYAKLRARGAVRGALLVLFKVALGLSRVDDARIEFRGIRRRGSGVSILIRQLHNEETEAIYIEVPLVRNEQRQVAWSDLVFHMSRMSMAQLVQSTEAPLTSLGGNLTPEEGARLQLACDEAGMRFTLMQAGGKVEEAIKLFDSLPRRVRSNSDVAITFVDLVAQKGDDKQFAAAVTRFRRLRPNDLGLFLHELDLATRSEDWEAVLSLVRALSGRIGGDSWLTQWEGHVLWELGRHDEAREAFRRACREEPKLESTLWEWLAIEMELERWSAAADLLARLEETGGELDLEGLREIYPEFMNTPESRKWVESRER